MLRVFLWILILLLSSTLVFLFYGTAQRSTLRIKLLKASNPTYELTAGDIRNIKRFGMQSEVERSFTGLSKERYPELFPNGDKCVSENKESKVVKRVLTVEFDQAELRISFPKEAEVSLGSTASDGDHSESFPLGIVERLPEH